MERTYTTYEHAKRKRKGIFNLADFEKQRGLQQPLCSCKKATDAYNGKNVFWGIAMLLSALFTQCLSRSYLTVGHDVDYAIERRGDGLYLWFESSSGTEDWRKNLHFPARPYRSEKGDLPWFAHRGFLEAWNGVRQITADAVMDETVRSVTVVGYSHGAAIAVFCHEYVWYHRPDLRDALFGYGFGCPRVLWGRRNAELVSRWEHFTVIRNIDDVVTHLPPSALGYFHVGSLLEIGERGRYSAIDAHRPESILRELVLLEKSQKKE